MKLMSGVVVTEEREKEYLLESVGTAESISVLVNTQSSQFRSQ